MVDSSNSEAADCEWRAGTATEIITPEEQMWMAGFGFRDGPSQGVERDLRAKALAIEDRHGNRAVFVSAELLFVLNDVRDAVACRCSDQYGIAPDALFVNATHTHCGPEYREYKVDMQADDVEAYGKRAERYRDELEETLVSLVGTALDDLSAAELRFDQAQCGFAMSRRRPTEEGVKFEPYPDGPVDHDVPVLTVRDPDGETVRAIVFGYACHTTSVINCDGWRRFHGDWAGFAQRYLEEAYPDATAVFVQGCAGDQNAFPRGSLPRAKQHGRSIANSVEVAVESSRKRVSGPLRSIYEEQPIAFEAPPSRAELAERSESDERTQRVRARELLTELEETGSIATEYPLPIQGIGFGEDLTIVGLGGEVLVEYALQLKEQFDGDLWVAGYTNSEFTYVPTTQVIYEGGYEGGGVIRYTTFPGPLKPDVENRVLNRARAVAKRVSGPD